MKEFFKQISLFIVTFLFFIHPNVLAESPSDVPLNKIWDIEFTKKINPNSVKDGRVYIYNSDYEKIPTTFQVSEDKLHLLVWTDTVLFPNTEYNIYISKDLSSEDNHSLNKDTLYNFKTEELKDSNFELFKTKLLKSSVKFTFSSEDASIDTWGLLVGDRDDSSVFAYTYVPENFESTNLSLSIDGTSVHGEIYHYHPESNMLVVKVDKGNSYSHIYHSSSKENEKYFDWVVDSVNMRFDQSGNVVFAEKAGNESPENRLYLNDIEAPANTISFNKISSIKDTLHPPVVKTFSYDPIGNKLNLSLETENSYVIYYSINNDDYKALLDESKKIYRFSESDQTLDLSLFSGIPEDESFHIYFKIYSSKSGDLSSNFSHCNLNVEQISHSSRQISIVKNGKFNPSDSLTIEEIFDNYFVKGSWSISPSDDSEVNFTGTGLYNGHYATYKFVFFTNVKNSSFWVEKVLVDGYPVDFAELPALLKELYTD